MRRLQSLPLLIQEDGATTGEVQLALTPDLCRAQALSKPVLSGLDWSSFTDRPASETHRTRADLDKAKA